MEDRTVPSAGQTVAEAIGVAFADRLPVLRTAHTTGYLADVNDVVIYRVSLNAGDRLTARVDTAPYGGGFDSLLRVYQLGAGGTPRPIASNDNALGLDAGLTFQATSAGLYAVVVSGFDNTAYDPSVAVSGTGTSRGLFDLDLSASPAAPVPALTVTSFQLSEATGTWGDTVTVRYTVENRGAATSSPTTASLLVSGGNRFDDGLPALRVGSIPALAGGSAYHGTFTAAVGDPGTPPVYFADSQRIFLGLQVGPTPPAAAAAGNDWAALQMLTAVTAPADGSNQTLATAASIPLDSRTTAATLPPGAADYYRVTLAEHGNLRAAVDADGGRVSVALYDARGVPIVQSDGQSEADPDPLITHGLSAGTYYLKVGGRGPAATSYTMTTQFRPSVSVLNTVSVAATSVAVAAADFDGDGTTDLIAATRDADGTTTNDIRVVLGNGDGTFRMGSVVPLDVSPRALVVRDFDADGRLDVVVAATTADGVRVVLGNGDGTFRTPVSIEGLGGNVVGAGDFDGDGRLDLVVTDPDTRLVNVLLGTGDGRFRSPSTFALPDVPTALGVGDFDGDGRPDVAVATTTGVTVLLTRPEGGFREGGSFAVGHPPSALVVGDFDRDGRSDLATANHVSDDVATFFGNGDGSFRAAGTFEVGSRPDALVTGDFDGDGRLDLATANFSSNDVTLLFGGDDGSFRAGGTPAVGANPSALAAGDFNGDGRPDLAAGNFRSRDVTVLLANGVGRFPRGDAPNSTGQHPNAVAGGDFDGDGRPDLAVADRESNTVSVLLGQGDGTFRSLAGQAAGDTPAAVVAGDFNGDGRLDLAVADYGSTGTPGVTILIGSGNGEFRVDGFHETGGSTADLAAGDFDGDGDLDLAYVLKSNADYSYGTTGGVLVGSGDGRFRPGDAFQTGVAPTSLVAGDFDGDGRLDLAVANYYSQDVTVLTGNGRGRFTGGVPVPLAATPFATEAGDFDGDGDLDLAVVTFGYDNVTVLLNVGGTLAVRAVYSLDTSVTSLTAGDFTGDGVIDLAATGIYSYDASYENSVTLLVGTGAGSFRATPPSPAGDGPYAAAAGDFNGDTRPDLAVVDYNGANVTVLLGTGGGAFVAPVLAPNPVRSTPLVANFTGGPTPDAVVLTQGGRVLYRRGLPGVPGAFAPPVVLNPDPLDAARGLALVAGPAGTTLLAALDARTFAAAAGPAAARTPRVTVYQPHPDGTFAVLRHLDLPAGGLPADLASADLTGDGLGDLVVTAAAGDQVFVSVQLSPGVFSAPTAYSVGVNPSAVTLADVTGDGLRDAVVADQFSGQVSVLVNRGGGLFAPERRYNAATGLYGLAAVNGTLAVRSGQGTSGVVAGVFHGSGTDLVVLNTDQGGFTTLLGDGDGFSNPRLERTVFTSDAPTAVASADFDGDGRLDVAALSEDAGTVSIYAGDGAGGFVWLASLTAGTRPTGLSVGDVSRPGGGGADGVPDLLVGNAYGDLLVLPGNGDGTFADYRRAGQAVSLAVAVSAAGGANTFFFSAQGTDRLAYKSAAARTAVVAGAAVYQDRADGVRAPGAEAVVAVGGARYLVVLNGGANAMLVLTLAADGRPIPASVQTYATGTDPAGVTITGPTDDLNGDGIPDVLVANRGSNDVSVFLGEVRDGTWGLAYRPRQGSGGVGPTSVAVADVGDVRGFPSPDGSPDLIVANGDSNTVRVLPGVGNGYFTSRSAAPAIFVSRPAELILVNPAGGGGPGVVAVNPTGGEVTLVTNLLTVPILTTLRLPEGSFPTAAVVRGVGEQGADEILVTNAISGTLELLRIDSTGFEVARSWDQDFMRYVSDLAVVTAGNTFEVYGTEVGGEAAVLLAAFGLAEPDSDTTVVPPPGFTAPLETRSTLAYAVLDRPFSFAPVSGTPPTEADDDSAAGASFFGGIDLTFVTTPVGVFADSEDEDEDEDDNPPDRAATRPRGDGLEVLLNNLPDFVSPEGPAKEDAPDKKDVPEGTRPDESHLDESEVSAPPFVGRSTSRFVIVSSAKAAGAEAGDRGHSRPASETQKLTATVRPGEPELQHPAPPRETPAADLASADSSPATSPEPYVPPDATGAGSPPTDERAVVLDAWAFTSWLTVLCHKLPQVALLLTNTPRQLSRWLGYRAGDRSTKPRRPTVAPDSSPQA